MYDLENYETVKERKRRFYEDYPDGRIIVQIQNTDVLEYALFMATVYRDKSDTPFSTGYALEIRDTELKISREGNEYQSVNYSSWVENCEESAVGRALDNAGYSGNNKCSREEMGKVNRMSRDVQDKNYESYTKNPACPNCGSELYKDKGSDGFFCWKKKNGCGKNFNADLTEKTKDNPTMEKKEDSLKKYNDFLGKLTDEDKEYLSALNDKERYDFFDKHNWNVKEVQKTIISEKVGNTMFGKEDDLPPEIDGTMEDFSE